MRRWVYGSLSLLTAIVLFGMVVWTPRSGALVPDQRGGQNNGASARAETEDGATDGITDGAADDAPDDAFPLQGLPGLDLRGVEERSMTGDRDEALARIRLSDLHIKEVDYHQIVVTRDGTVWVDAHWVGPDADKPDSPPAWNGLAQEVAHQVAGDYVHNRAIIIRLFEGDQLMAERVARSMGG